MSSFWNEKIFTRKLMYPFFLFSFSSIIAENFSSLKAPLVKISIFILFLLREKMKPVRVMQPCPSRDLNSWKFRPRLKLSMKRVSLTEIGYKKTLNWIRWELGHFIYSKLSNLDNVPGSPLPSSHTGIIYDVIQIITYYLVRSLYDY